MPELPAHKSLRSSYKQNRAGQTILERRSDFRRVPRIPFSAQSWSKLLEVALILPLPEFRVAPPHRAVPPRRVSRLKLGARVFRWYSFNRARSDDHSQLQRPRKACRGWLTPHSISTSLRAELDQRRFQRRPARRD